MTTKNVYFYYMLYIVPTPLGNLQDITLRAIEVLRACDFVLAEDTRHSQKLLQALAVSKPLVRYNENDPSSISKCLALAQTRTCALVSDCGTPCISDPGFKLVTAAREKNIKVVPLPGPSALTCALSGAGVGGGGFTFLGFMPRKPGKITKLLTAAYALERPVVIYESPYRVIKLLEIISAALGVNTRVVLARELTKVYEEFISGTAEELIKKMFAKDKILGEFIVIIDAHTTDEDDDDDTGA